MQTKWLRRGRALVAAVSTSMVLASSGRALPSASPPAAVSEIAQAHGTEPRELDPRYKPVPPEEKGWYNSDYIFGLTRGVAASTIAPAGKAPLYVLTVPLDLVFLPFAAIGGLFG
jgi:hypothetical protein